MHERAAPLPVVIELERSALRLQSAVVGAFGLATVCAWAASNAPAFLILAVCGCIAAACLTALWNFERAPRRLEWLGASSWKIESADGRMRVGRLSQASRCWGRSSLLVFERGVFSRHDRCWVLVLPRGARDAASLRRLRARLLLDRQSMCTP